MNDLQHPRLLIPIEQHDWPPPTFGFSANCIWTQANWCPHMITCCHSASLINHQILFSKLQSVHKLHYNSNVKLTTTSKYGEKSPLPNKIMYEELTLQLHISSHEDIHTSLNDEVVWYSVLCPQRKCNQWTRDATWDCKVHSLEQHKLQVCQVNWLCLQLPSQASPSPNYIKDYFHCQHREGHSLLALHLLMRSHKRTSYASVASSIDDCMRWAVWFVVCVIVKKGNTKRSLSKMY